MPMVMVVELMVMMTKLVFEEANLSSVLFLLGFALASLPSSWANCLILEFKGKM